MTADEIRGLEIEVAKAMGYAVKPYNIAETLCTMVSPNGAYSMIPNLMAATPEQVWQKTTKRYITDPTATAEVRDWIDAQLWGWVSANRGGKHSDIVVFEIYSPESQHLAEAFEERSKHGGKASQAEAAAMCRCVLQACRATGATEGEGQKEGEA